MSYWLLRASWENLCNPSLFISILNLILFSSLLTDLIYKLYRRSENYADLTFQLPDGTSVHAHKLILVIASSYFEAMFCGPLADKNHNGTVEIRGVDSDAFRRLLDFIYNSGPMDWDMDNIDYFNLLDAANMYIIPGKTRAINICIVK